MFRHSDDFLHEIERFHRTLQKALTTGEKVISQVQKTLPQWFRGPQAEVFDDGYKVRIELEAKGLSENNTWGVRAVDRYLLLRGEDAQEGPFTKLIHLPSPVKRKPMTATLHGQHVTLEFVKTTSSRLDDRWFEFEIN